MAAIHRLFDALLERKGSDLHLGVGTPPMIRSSGELTPLPGGPLRGPELETLLYEILDERQRTQIRDEWDLDFAYGYGDKARFRGNYFWKTSGIGAVFRTIPSEILSLDDLGVPAGIRQLAARTEGLVLVTGPTGSGKSTTLAAMVDSINRTRKGHILTIEDPVEFVHKSRSCLVTHREVGRDAPSFVEAIRSAGRENADVILVGELRGPETMRLALQLSSFGVLVFATVHTNSAPATIDRFVNAFPAAEQPQIRGLLADSLAGIVAQQLCRKVGGKGRVAAHEILIGTPAVSSLVREGKSHQLTSVIQGGTSEGMQSMDAALERLVKAKTIDPETGLEKALDKDRFAKLPEVQAALQAHGEDSSL